jgi:hypothetical protein
LYKLRASISHEKNGTGDSREVVFGIRTVAIHKDMSYWLNGKRLFLKGAWYPMSDYYGSKPNRETFLKDLQLLRAANLNHLVAFTVVEKPDFYELCDRLGILEIFELPFNQDGPVDVLPIPILAAKHSFASRSARYGKLSLLFAIILPLSNGPLLLKPMRKAEGGVLAIGISSSTGMDRILTQWANWSPTLTRVLCITPVYATWESNISGWATQAWATRTAITNIFTQKRALFQNTDLFRSPRLRV